MDFEYTRDKFEQLLKIPSEKRTDDELYELMKLTSDFKIFESIAMNKIHKEICKYIFLKVYEKGEIIFKQGDEGDAGCGNEVESSRPRWHWRGQC